jgi:two-component system chemotaxis response regulator CheB
VEALRIIAAALPADLPAALLVVLHLPPDAHSALPRILSRAGPLPAGHAVDGQQLQQRRIAIAPPDRHLLVAENTTVLSLGPREHQTRPAVDPLFRSAARWHGSRVVAVVLSGGLDDGAAGAAAVQARGGIVLVQDPDDALHSSMPRATLSAVPHARSIPARELGQMITLLVMGDLLATPSDATGRELRSVSMDVTPINTLRNPLMWMRNR